MRTCVLSDTQELTLTDRNRPTTAPDEALVRVGRVGICGSDIHYYRNGENSGNVVDFPHVLGHEASGTVIEVGEEVTDFSVDDRVAIEPGVPCGDCSYCREESAYHLCKDMEYMSSPPIDGALIEYVAWPAECLYSLPNEVSLREGALVEPLSVAMHACERGNVSEGDTVLVTGGGPIGQLVAEVAMWRGAKNTVLTDVVPEKLKLATERGVDYAVDVGSEDPVQALHEKIDIDSVDVVVESSGAESAIQTTTEAVKRGGTVVFVGIPPDAPVVLSGKDFVGHPSTVTSVASRSPPPFAGDGTNRSNASAGVSSVSQSRLMCGRSSL
jgi:L-iditol 2-dehydrogenase